MKTQIFHERMHDLKGHPRSNKTTFMPKSFKKIRLWTDSDEIGMNANIMKRKLFHKCHFHVMEKFCEFFTLRPANLVKIYLKIHSEGSKVT